MMWSTS